ncbi:hypothetical protein ABBQ38_014470 [Trebouxia sp. C0009 RCD-2024]
MATLLCSSFQAVSLQQARVPRCSAPTCRPNTSATSLCWKRSSFSAGQTLQQPQLPQVQTAQLCLTTCSKGKKLKTRKAAAKRFKITGTGKVVLRHPGKQHINEKKSSKRLSQLGKPHMASDTVLPGIKGNLPYKKITKSGN